MNRKTVDIEANSLDEARTQLRSQLPEGYFILSQKVLADGSDESIAATAQSMEEAFLQAESQLPANARGVVKREIRTAREDSACVEGFDEEAARCQAAARSEGEHTITKVELTQQGKRGFLGFGKKPNKYTCRVLHHAKVEIRYRRKPRISAEIAEEPAFRRVLGKMDQHAVTRYEDDRDNAFAWFDQQSFPCPPLNTLECAKYATDMSLMADGSSIWKEAWAGFHRALTSCLHIGEDAEIPDIVWRLGRAHTGLGNHPLAALYLRAAESLLERSGKRELHERVLLDTAVLAALQDEQSEYRSAIGRVLDVFFPGGTATANAARAAFTIFDEGRKNQQWRKDGQSVPSCLKHAHGFYQVSLDMNKKLGNKKALGFSVINLGDVAKKLGRHDRAQGYWQEALQVFRDLRDDTNIGEVKNRLEGR